MPTRCAEDNLSHTSYEFLVMPFGLTNTLSIFKSLINEVFRPYLRLFILVLLDDILIYNRTWEDHIHHLCLTLDLPQAHSLFVKMSKYYFGRKELEYLGHIVSGKEIVTDSNKIQAIVDWPILGMVRAF